MKYWDRDIRLVDKYEVIIRIWKWLQQCSYNDIINLPKFETGVDLRTCNLSEEELLFCGMCAGIASTQPRFKVSMFAGEQNGRKNRFKNIADNLHKIKHWQIECDDYINLKNEEATWFIDPPYQFGGHAYIENKIDYEYLGNWCKERMGQTIVCENTKADWLPFTPMTTMRGANQQFTTEALWSNIQTNYSNVQTTINF